MKKLLLVFGVVLMSLPMMVMAQCGTNLTATDQDGTTYQSLKVGPHCWMQTNLKTNVSGSKIYRSDMYPDTSANLAIFGRLYPWAVASDPNTVGEHNFVKGVCPEGWHLPLPVEAQQLSTNRASAVRSTEHWLIPGNNTTGFSLQPGGFYNNGTLRFENLGGEAYLWSVGAAGEPVEVWTDCHCDMILLNPGKVNNPLSVRCVYKIYQAQVATEAATDIKAFQANLNGNVVFAGYDQNFKRGFVYGTDINNLTYDTVQTGLYVEGNYTYTVKNLEPNTTYYYRAYVINEFDVEYGPVVSFTTPELKCTTGVASDITMHTAVLNADVTDLGGYPMVNAGFLWGLDRNNLNNSAAYATDIIATGSYHCSLSNLTEDTKYFYCAYVTNGDKVEYGDTLDFTTAFMQVQTDAATAVTPEAATLNGNLSQLKVFNTCNAGFKYGTSESTLTSIVAVETAMTNPGQFYSNIAGLTANTTYYFKAFVANGTDTVYGEVNDFTTHTDIVTDTIAFQPNGGQGTMDTMFVTRGEQVTLPANGFTHDGNWEFTGWNDACDGTGNIYTVAENITINGNLTLYAQWDTWCTGNPQNNELGTSRIDSVKDHENNWYKVVRIGSQCWLKENLRTTTEPNGGTIVLNADSNSNTTPMAYSSNVAKYGYLYNFAAAMNIADDATDFSYPHRGICPNGWHIPTNEEWTTLAAEAGVDINDGAGAGGAGKLAGGNDWNDAEEATAPGNYNYTTRDSTGFFALPAGYSYGLGDYGVGGYAYFWSATSDESIRAYSWFIVSDYEYISNSSQMRYYGSSLRCLRDAEASVVTDTIAFLPNGGQGTMDTIFVTRGEQVTLPANRFTHDGNWEFSGWNDACDGTGNIYTAAENITTNGNLTLYAQWHTWCAGTPLNNELGTSRIDSVKDVNNNKYAVVQIGNQCWLKENMRATTEPNGTNTIEINADEISENSPIAYYDNNEYLVKYGCLYNYSAAMNITDDANSYEYPHQGICPQGWHIPTDEEWNTLMVSAGVNRMNGDEGVGKLTGGCDWEETAEKPYSPGNYSYSKRDSSGFSILPAGLNMGDGIVYAGFGATFWSSTSHAHDEGPLYWAILNSNIEESGYVQNSNNDRFVGLSVRCLRDAEASVVTDTIAFLPNGGQGTMDTMFVTRGNTVLNANTFTHSGNWQFLGWNAEADGSGTAYANQASLTTNGNLTLYAQWGTYCAGTPRANELGTSRVDSVKDVDNNKYAVVQIGNQCWMRQNLRTNVGGGVYPENKNQREQDSILYGRLYTWTAMMNGASSTNYPVGSTAADTIVHGICPAGWHVPSASEWNALVTYVKGVTEYKCGGGDDPIAKALSFNMGWKSSTQSCAPGESESENNLTGFSAFPAGYYSPGTKNFSEFAYFWSATQHSDKEAVDYYLQYKVSKIESYRSKKEHGESVRCLRDNEQ